MPLLWWRFVWNMRNSSLKSHETSHGSLIPNFLDLLDLRITGVCISVFLIWETGIRNEDSYGIVMVSDFGNMRLASNGTCQAVLVPLFCGPPCQITYWAHVIDFVLQMYGMRGSFLSFLSRIFSTHHSIAITCVVKTDLVQSNFAEVFIRVTCAKIII